MENKKKIDDAVMKALSAKVIRRLICITDKGNLDLVIRKGENEYFITIDSVPLEKEVNDKLMGILFKPEVSKLDIVAQATEDYTKRVINPQVIDVVLGKKKGKKAKVK